MDGNGELWACIRRGWGTFLRTPGLREACLVFILALSPRVHHAGQFMTIDEPTWMNRSKTFAKALIARDWRGTDQTRHPGVTLMWLGTISMGPRLVWDYLTMEKAESGQRPGLEAFTEGYGTADLAKYPQMAVGITCSVGLGLIAFFLTRLKDPIFGLWAGLFMALEPWLVGHSRVFHLDMLMSTFTLLSFLLLLMDLKHPSRKWVMASGCVCAVAFLTKLPGILVAGFVPILGLCHVLSGKDRSEIVSWRRIWELAIYGLSWFVAFCATACLLWPALLFHPVATTKRVISGMVIGAETWQSMGGFFMGQTVADGSPGYVLMGVPCVSSPEALALAGMGVILLVGFMWKRDKSWWPVLATGVFGLMFTLAMVQASMRTVRYILVALLCIDLLAGVVPAAICAAISRKGMRALALGIIMAPAAVLLAHWHPYEIAYVTPFLEGRPIDRDVISRGWGEGLQEAAVYLNQKPGAEQLKVAVWYAGVFAPYFRGKTVDLGRCLTEKVDYVIMYANQIQRKRDALVVERYWSTPPEKVIRVKRRDMAWIYPAKAE